MESENLNELGLLSIDSVKHPMSASTDTLFTEMTVASMSEVNIKMSGKRETWITGCTFMPNGDVVLCDTTNNNIKLLSGTFTIKDSLQLDYPPWDVSPVSSNSVVTTLPHENQLQFIQVMPTLKRLDRSIKVDRNCWGVQVVEDLIYVTCHNNPGKGEVLILDMNGTVTHRLGQPDKKPSMFFDPSYITVCPSTRKLFLSDWSRDTVSCLLSDGTVVYQYKDEELRRPYGVCVDGGGNVIVCGRRSNNVQVIRADGTKCCTLLTSQDGVSDPFSVAYRQSDNTLILGCAERNNLFVYKMK